jgi:hypothetical protein
MWIISTDFCCNKLNTDGITQLWNFMSYIFSVRQIVYFQAPVPSTNNAVGSPHIFFMNTIYVGFKTRYVSMGFVVVNRPRLIFERFCVILLYSLLAFYMEHRRKINNFEPALHYVCYNKLWLTCIFTKLLLYVSRKQ